MSATTIDRRMAEALRDCGVTDTTPSSTEKQTLDRDGYLVFPDLCDRAWLTQLDAAFDLALANGHRHGVHVHLDWQEPVFDLVYTHPRILAAVAHLLKEPFKSTGVVGRDPVPGFGQQGLHTDYCPSVTALWLLDDFTENNGATRLIPGSHHLTRPLLKALQQPESRHPQQRLVQARAGSVLLFTGRLWHGGTRNESKGSRRVLQSPYVDRKPKSFGDGKLALPTRLTATVRYLLGEED